MTDAEIGARVGVCLGAICRWRRRRGLNAHDRPNAPLKPEEVARRLLLYQLGASDSRIAKAEGVQHSAIAHWRERNRLPSNLQPGQTERHAVIQAEATLMRRVRSAIARYLPPDIADDAVSDMILALLDGTIPLNDIEKEARRYGNRVLERFANKWGARSLDEEIGDDGDGFRLVDLIRDDRSSSWLEEMGATVW